MAEMRVLTVRQPWAWAIIHAGKTVENRTRNLAGAYRGPVAIHAGLGYDEDAVVWFDDQPLALDEDGSQRELSGAIIGVVDLVDVHHGPEFGGGCHRLNSPVPVTPTYDLCSSWGEAGAYHLVLANPRPLAEPIAFRGGLGLRRLDGGTRLLVESQLVP